MMLENKDPLAELDRLLALVEEHMDIAHKRKREFP